MFSAHGGVDFVKTASVSPSCRLTTVGIDVGTSTTQVVFSELRIQNTSGHFRVPEAKITAKEILYRSPVHQTPLADSSRINAGALRDIVAEEYGNAGIPVGKTDTGAVIITGESARKENAAAVLAALSNFAGRFVVATAGPDLESRIAGQGSGAQEISRTQKNRVINLDIGGGTTNLAFFDSGDFSACSCFDIGGKMLSFHADGRLKEMSESALITAAHMGLRLTLGTVPLEDTLVRLADALAAELTFAARGKSSALLEKLRTPNSSREQAHGFKNTGPQPAICLSGGVADCVWSESLPPLAYGDFGVYLGRAIKKSELFRQVIRTDETIRATVIGAGSHTMELSGSTVHYSANNRNKSNSINNDDLSMFPLQNIPVFRVPAEQEEQLWRGDFSGFEKSFADFLRQTDSVMAAAELCGKPNPGYRELILLARALARSLTGESLIILLHEDNAKALGQILRPLLDGRPLVVLDSIRAGANTYLDIAKPILGGMTLPVVVKTLIIGV